MSLLLKQRWGRFYIDDFDLHLAQSVPTCSCGVSITGGEHTSYCDITNPKSDPLYSLFGQMIIVRAEHLLYNRKTEYVAHSELFEICREGIEIPEYEMIYNEETNTWKAQRLK